MMLKTALLNIAAAGAVFLLPGGANAASVDVLGSFSTPGVYSIVTNKDTTPSYESSYWYELVNNSASALLAKFTLVDTNPDGKRVRYRLWTDSDADLGSGCSAASPCSGVANYDVLKHGNGAAGTAGSGPNDESPTDNPTAITPFFTVLLNPGAQYVLEINKTVSDWTQITTQISAVPLPGAIWLFGSAILGFLGMSGRRKRKAAAAADPRAPGSTLAAA